MTLIYGYDTEYDNRDQDYEEVVLYRKKGITKFKKLKYKHVLYGLYYYNNDEYVYYENDNKAVIKKIINDLENSKDNHAIVYSFFNYADISLLDLGYFIHLGWTITNLTGLGNSIYVRVEKGEKKDKKVIEFLDVMKITSATNLDSFLKAMLGTTSKDIKEDKHPYELPFDVMVEYNKQDCILMIDALHKFFKIIKGIANTFGVELKDFYRYKTMGMFITKILSSYSDKVDNSFLRLGSINEEFKGATLVKGKRKVKEELNAQTIKELISIGKKSYRGGGIIHNLTSFYQRSKFIRNIDMVDFKSLYPISGLIACHEINNNVDSYKSDYTVYEGKQAEDKVKLLIYEYKHKKYNGIVNVEGYFKEGSIPLMAQKVSTRVIDSEEDNDIMYKTVFPKKILGDNYVSLFELSKLMELGFKVIKVKHIYYWTYPNENEKILSVINWFTYLIKMKDKAEEEGNMGLRYIIKILLNSTYGKLAEHRVTSIVNNLVASMLTSYSRSIMLWLVKVCFDNNYRVFHLATDSLIIDELKDMSMFDEVQNFVRKYMPDYKILSKETHDNPCHAYILKLKAYLIFDKDMRVIKLAHHGISIEKSKVKSFMLHLFKNGKNLDPYLIQKDSWLKVNKWNLYKQIMINNIPFDDQYRILKEWDIDTSKPIDPDIKEKMYLLYILKYFAMPIKNERIYMFVDDFKVKMSYSNPQEAEFVDFWDTAYEYNKFIEEFRIDFKKIKDKVKNGTRLNSKTYNSLSVLEKKYHYGVNILRNKALLPVTF